MMDSVEQRREHGLELLAVAVLVEVIGKLYSSLNTPHIPFNRRLCWQACPFYVETIFAAEIPQLKIFLRGP